MLEHRAHLESVVVLVDLVSVLLALAAGVIGLIRSSILLAVFVTRQVCPHDDCLGHRWHQHQATRTVPPVPPLFLFSVSQHRLHPPRADIRRLAKEVDDALNAFIEHAIVLEPREQRRRPVATRVDDHRAVAAFGEQRYGDLDVVVLLRGACSTPPRR